MDRPNVLYIADDFESVYSLNLDTLKWQALPPIHMVNFFFSLVEAEGKLYAMGGNSNRATVFDPEANQWTDISPMNERRRIDAAAVSHDWNIYITGGFNGRDYNYLNTCERYDILSDSWTNLPNMHHGRTHHHLLVHQDRLYAIGGDKDDIGPETEAERP